MGLKLQKTIIYRGVCVLCIWRQLFLTPWANNVRPQIIGVKYREWTSATEGLVQKMRLGLDLRTWVEFYIQAVGFTDEQSLERPL